MKQEYILDGLSCANCALKIEDRVKSNDHWNQVHLNLATQTLSIETDELSDDLSNQLQQLVNRIEDGVIVHRKQDYISPSVDKGQEKKENSVLNNNHKMYRFVLAMILFAASLLLKIPISGKIILYVMAYVIAGGDVLLRALKNIVRGQLLDENFLMAIATIGAFSIGEYAEAVAVMLFYQLGELFQDKAVNKSRKSIAKLMDIRPDTAWIENSDGHSDDKELKEVPATSIDKGQIILVKPGQRIPLDGKVIKGSSRLDTSALTGESIPRKVMEGDMVLSGSVNQNGLLRIETTTDYSNSTVSRILNLVENASAKKAETEKFITKFARYYTPVIVFLAAFMAIIPPIVIEGATFNEWLHRSLIFLVISCPCALVISIPLGFFGGIGRASRSGILIKGGNYLEGLNKIETVVFDKTGTLTKGAFEVTEVHSIYKSEAELLRLAAKAESHSDHPIALSIVKAGSESVDHFVVEGYEELAGKGVKAHVDGQEVLVGNNKLMQDNDVRYDDSNVIGSVVHIATKMNSAFVYEGYIVVSDEIKSDSKKTIETLRKYGVKKVVLLTGDHKKVADSVGASLSVDAIYSQLLPHEKVEKLEAIMSEATGLTAFVGDGINDAPVLARADIGIAMGGIGSDAAIEAADMVLMTDEPFKLVEGIKIAKKTRTIVWQNIGFAMGVKLLVLALGTGGLATMWEAVFADVGVALIAVMNAMRIIHSK